jgi:site-specific DNA recombinase
VTKRGTTARENAGLGRMVRGVEAVWMCGIAVDNATRVLAPNDGIDTNDETWEHDALEACAAHDGHNAHTSNRRPNSLAAPVPTHGGALATDFSESVIVADASTPRGFVSRSRSGATREGV